MTRSVAKKSRPSLWARWVRMTYKANFATVYANHAEVGKMSLRRAQMKSAVDELNPSMLKWLGQQFLGQRDKTSK